MNKRAVLLSAVLLVITPAAYSDFVGHAKTYGTAAETVLTLHPFAFEPRASADGMALQANSVQSRYCTTGCQLVAPVLLPAGASVLRLELDFCDSIVAGDVNYSLERTGAGGGPYEVVIGASSSGPGCAIDSATLAVPHTFDSTFAYMSVVTLSGTDESTRLIALRIFYKLQVSPAPATATFADVPMSHPFFQWIEALAAAGITAGCTAPPNPQFCPNAPLTRGQMAVFLSRALGLHWP